MYSHASWSDLYFNVSIFIATNILMASYIVALMKNKSNELYTKYQLIGVDFIKGLPSSQSNLNN